MNTVSARKKLVDKLVDKLEKFADESVCVCSYTICVILSAIALAISIGIGAYFAYSCWYLRKRYYSCKVWYPYSNNSLINL